MKISDMIVESSVVGVAHSYAPKGPWSLRSEAGAAASCTESARIQLGVSSSRCTKPTISRFCVAVRSSVNCAKQHKHAL